MLFRSDFATLLDAADTAADVACIDRVRAREKDIGKLVAGRDYLTEQEMQRLLDGENRLHVWREQRGVPQGALAQAIGISASYLADVETGIKPRSTDLHRRVAAFLELPLEVLLPLEPPPGASPMRHQGGHRCPVAPRAIRRTFGRALSAVVWSSVPMI